MVIKLFNALFKCKKAGMLFLLAQDWNKLPQMKTQKPFNILINAEALKKLSNIRAKQRARELLIEKTQGLRS